MMVPPGATACLLSVCQSCDESIGVRWWNRCLTSFCVSMDGKLLSKSPMSAPMEDVGAGALPSMPPPRRSSSSPSSTLAALSLDVLKRFASSPRAARSRARKSEDSESPRASKFASPPLTSVWPVDLSVAVAVLTLSILLWVFADLGRCRQVKGIGPPCSLAT